MSKDDNEEWNLMYDIQCWHCERFHKQKCKGKPRSVANCVNFEEREDEKRGR